MCGEFHLVFMLRHVHVKSNGDIGVVVDVTVFIADVVGFCGVAGVVIAVFVVAVAVFDGVEVVVVDVVVLDGVLDVFVVDSFPLMSFDF